jgi:hypothetical protein
MVFLYDINGFIAGMQSPVPVANTDNQYFDYDASAAYNKDTIAGVEVLFNFFSRVLDININFSSLLVSQDYRYKNTFSPISCHVHTFP